MELSGSIVITLASWIDLFMRRSMHNFFLYAKQNGLSITQIAALFMVHRRGTCNVSDLGDYLEITQPAASQLLERLVQQGLVIRAEDPNDRRLKQIALSKQGEIVLHEGLQARQKWLEDLVDSLSPDEQQQVIAAMKLMLDKAQGLETHQ
jgi:MarR family transcriptional regulator for hemolysin